MMKRCPALFFLVVSFAFGIVVAQYAAATVFILMLLGWCILGLLPIVKTYARVWRGMWLLLCFFCGALYTHGFQYIAQNHLVHIFDRVAYQSITLEGVVVSEVRQRPMVNTTKSSFSFSVSQVTAGSRTYETTGRVLVQLYEFTPIEFGDRLRLTGKLHRPFEFSQNDTFSYRTYLRHRGIHHILSVKKDNPVERLGQDQRYWWRAFLLALRNGLAKDLDAYYLKGESGILKAILLGDRSSIPGHIREIFIRTGTAHVLAVSGLHVGMVAMLMMFFWQVLRLPRSIQLFLTLMGILLYAVMAGARPSIMRAAIMSMVFIGSLIQERETNALGMLGCASLLILLMNPLTLYDIGFQLSFACILSMITIGRQLEHWVKPWMRQKGWKGWRWGMVRSVLISFAIWVGVEGLVIYHFQIATPVSVLANFFVIPLIFGVVFLGMGFLLSLGLMPWLALCFVSCLKVTLSVLVGVSFLCSRIPGAYVYLPPITLWQLALYYLIIGMIFGMPWGIIGSKFKCFHLWRKN